ncbi:MAG: hypothetical protein IPI04_07780 [Ignavibacteria bacterium]|nr:hypothetical protein [Ignavibacteria bacterium]
MNELKSTYRALFCHIFNTVSDKLPDDPIIVFPSDIYASVTVLCNSAVFVNANPAPAFALEIG